MAIINIKSINLTNSDMYIPAKHFRPLIIDLP